MSTRHVVPVGDLIAHVVPGGTDDLDSHEQTALGKRRWLTIEALPDETRADTDCPCGPEVERVLKATGPDGWLITHHSLDGRELTEACS